MHMFPVSNTVKKKGANKLHQNLESSQMGPNPKAVLRKEFCAYVLLSVGKRTQSMYVRIHLCEYATKSVQHKRVNSVVLLMSSHYINIHVYVLCI